MPARIRPVTWLLIALLSACVLPACSEPASAVASPDITAPDNPPLPIKIGSIKFAVIGDSGQWSDNMKQLAQQVAAQRNRFPFDFVIMLGDNNYGDGGPESFRVRFDEPYKPLLDAGVKFYAALGNHDQEIGEEWKYPAFNMEGHRYLTFEKKDGPLPGIPTVSARFFVVNTNRLDNGQLEWLDRELGKSGADWKIAYMHHPLYTAGRYAMTTVLRRRTLEPVFIRNRVDVVFAGHEHLYERLIPQGGVMYFISGAAGAVRMGDLKPSPILAKGYDRDLSFMLVEIAGDTLYFQAINRLGETVDSGHIVRRKNS